MTNNFSFQEFIQLDEALDSDVGDVRRDDTLEFMAKMSLPTKQAQSVKVLYTDHMNDSNLRLIKFYNDDNNVEYHVHNQTLMSGKANNKSNRGFIDALKLIRSDAKDEIDAGRKIVLQTLPGSPQYQKFQSIAKHIAQKHGKTVTDGGMKPFASNPFLKGPTIVIE